MTNTGHVHIDDILITDHTESGHVANVEKVLQRLSLAGVKRLYQYQLIMVSTTNLRQHYFILAGLFSKREDGTGLHAAKSFDSVLCIKSETMMFLATTNGKDSSNKYSQSSSTPCVLVYLACPS